MDFILDLTDRIIANLLSQGYGGAGKKSVKNVCDITILGRNGRFVAVPGLIKVATTIDDAFQELLKGLDSLSSTYGFPEKIIFQGGGKMPLPEWFVSWCMENDIKIEILDPQVILQGH